MKSLFVGIFILLLLPISQSFSQEFTDISPPLSVTLNNEHFLYEQDGFSIFTGTIKNNSETAISNVILQVTFFDETDPNPVDIASGTTALQVIPAKSSSPFSISSLTTNPNISQAQVTLLGFETASIKQQGLKLLQPEILSDDFVRIYGELENGGATNSNTIIHLSFYDRFEPPRIIQLSSISIGVLSPNEKVPFEFIERIDQRAIGVKIFAESEIFSSNFIDMKLPEPITQSKLVTISNVYVTDNQNNRLSEIPLNSIVHINSDSLIQMQTSNEIEETPYTYYVQVKESSTGKVEYIGKYDGRIVGIESQKQVIDWIPNKSGLFFIETFVWDRNNIPIADQGPYVLINVQ